MLRMSVGGREIQGVLQRPGESRRDGIFAKGHKMIWSNPGRRAVLSAMVGLSLLAGAGQAGADAIKDLNNAFKDAYLGATLETLKKLRASVPMFVNRFGEIALYRPEVAKPDVFAMDMTLYLETRAVAHTAAALYAGLAPFGLGPLDPERLDWLKKYQSLLSAAQVEVKGRVDIPADLKKVQVGMLSDVAAVAMAIRQKGAVEQRILDHLGLTVRAAIRTNIEAAAQSQLEQFLIQVAKWKAAYPLLEWGRAVAVIIGIHQARDKYLQTQFFDWLLKDQPSNQVRVVYAETMTPPPPLRKRHATDALLLLSKVMLDKGLANTIFGDPLALQSDVLGDAAEAIIESWR